MSKRPKPPPTRRDSIRDPRQPEFGIVGLLPEYPFKLRAGDVIRFDNRFCRVLCVNYSSALVIMNRPIRKFTTRFDKPVCFQPPPLRFYISPNSEVEILNRKSA